MRKIILTTLLYMLCLLAPAQQIALLKYNGGGDWYANPTSLPNLIKFCNQQLGMSLETKPATVEVGSADIYRYPFIHMTGHGNVAFTDAEADNLRKNRRALELMNLSDDSSVIGHRSQHLYPRRLWRVYIDPSRKRRMKGSSSSRRGTLPSRKTRASCSKRW